ncbi:MAG: FIVAR domain-containing protein [Lachnospiraceae bacterium]|nr:FIVAR domain-containing protein [Lachnospiraceae bacterium]
MRNANGALMLLSNGAVEAGEKEVLQSVYNTSLTLQEENYTEESWAALVEEQQTVLVVLTNPNATQEEVDAALEALTAAYMGLVPEQETPDVDKTALQSLYTNALLLTESDYTSESWADLDEAMKVAKTVLDNEEATQEEVDAAWQTLLEAYGTLERNPADPDENPDSVNLDALLLLYESSLKLTESNYTSESWAPLVTAQAGALAVLNDTDPTQKEADDAFVVLSEALKGLVRVGDSDDPGDSGDSDDSGNSGGSGGAGTTPTTVDKAPLQAAYDASVPLTESKYTAASWVPFVEARAAALVVLEDDNATQVQVSEALAALLDAINGLVTYVDSATTGDSSALGLWIGIAVVALIAIVAVIVVYRKRMSKGGEK